MTVAHLAIVDWVKQDWQTGSFCMFSTLDAHRVFRGEGAGAGLLNVTVVEDRLGFHSDCLDEAMVEKILKCSIVARYSFYTCI